MTRILRGLAEDWEKAVLWSTLLAFACLALAAWHSSSRDGDSGFARPGVAPRVSLLGPDAYGFLDPQSRPLPAGDAFAFSYRVAPGGVVGHGDPPQTEVCAPPPASWPYEGDVLYGLGSEEPRDTKPPSRAGWLRYLGLYVSTTGEQLAAIELGDPDTGRSRTDFWHEGQTCSGFRLAGFDGDSLSLLAPGDEWIRVCRGNQRAIALGPLAPTAR